jgi:hypothetical protein
MPAVTSRWPWLLLLGATASCQLWGGASEQAVDDGGDEIGDDANEDTTACAAPVGLPAGRHDLLRLPRRGGAGR